MGTKTKIVVGLIIVLVSAAVGRYTAPVKVVNETKTVEVDKKTDDKTEDKHEHKVTKTVTNKDGSSTTTTVDDTNTGVVDNKTDNSSIVQDSKTETTRGSNSTTISALTGISIHDMGVPIYGGAINKPILGPIGVGAWGMSNGTMGLSLSLTF